MFANVHLNGRVMSHALGIAVVAGMIGVAPVAAQCVLCMNYHTCALNQYGVSTDCEEDPCGYTGITCLSNFAFDAAVEDRREARLPGTDAFVLLVRVDEHTFANWDCTTGELSAVARESNDGALRFLNVDRFRGVYGLASVREGSGGLVTALDG